MSNVQSNIGHLRKKLMRLLLLRLLIPMQLFTLVIIVGAGYIWEKNLESQQAAAAQSLSTTAERYLDQGIRIMNAISVISEDTEGEHWRQHLEGIWESYGYFETIYIIDDSYKVRNLIPYDGNYIGLDLSNMPDMRHVGQDIGATISSPFISLRTGEPTVYIVQRISNVGMAVGELNLSILQQDIQKEQDSHYSTVVYVMDKVGTLLAHPDINQVKQQMNLSRLAVFKSSNDSKQTMLYNDSGTVYLGSTAEVDPVGWIVVAQLPVLELFAPFFTALVGTVVIFAIIWVGIFVNLRKSLQGNVVDPLYQEFSRENQERMKAEEAVLETESRFQAIFNQTYQFIGLIDREGRLREANEAVRQFSGADAKEERGLFFWETAIWKHSREVQEQVQSAVGRALEGTFVRQEITAVSANGGIHILDFSLKPIMAADGSVAMIIPEGRDITELKQAEAALQQINEQLEERVAQRTMELEALNLELEAARNWADRANKAKTSFLASMSHELRTPLNAILGFSELMVADESLPMEAKRNLQIINRSGEHLLTLINDVLDLSKIESGTIELDIEDMDLHKMIRDIHELFRIKADKKGLRLSVELAADVPRRIRADERKIRQVLLNLIGNALKYTDAGHVALKLECVASGVEGILLRFSITDTGRGISKEEQEHLFKEYFQASGGRQAEESTGLGLAIASRIVNLLGGEIHVESEAQKGSTFSFEIVAAHASQEPSQAAAHKRITGIVPEHQAKRILIVDDEPNNSLLLKQVLERLGLKTEVASNGIEGIRLWEAWHPHLVLMDIHMPVMDGYEAARHIRSRENSDSTLMRSSIVGISASCFDEDRSKILEAGCDDFMMKPFMEWDLFMMLAKHLGVRFIYAEFHDDPVHVAINRLSDVSEEMTRLPVALLKALANAANNLETAELLAFIEQIGTLNHKLAAALTEKAHDFEYDAIYDWAAMALENLREE